MTISQQNGKWFVSIQVEMHMLSKKEVAAQPIGLDLGISKTITLSNGTIYQGAKSLRKHKAKLAKEQRVLAKKVKFSNNWRKQKAKVGRIHEKITNTRKDRNHWITTHITRSFTHIFAEKLKIKNQTKSAKGSIAKPGKMVKQKSGLNREILDQAWHEICRQLSYKSEWRGKIFWQVDPKYTSQKCNQCGNITKRISKTKPDSHVKHATMLIMLI